MLSSAGAAVVSGALAAVLMLNQTWTWNRIDADTAIDLNITDANNDTGQELDGGSESVDEVFAHRRGQQILLDPPSLTSGFDVACCFTLLVLALPTLIGSALAPSHSDEFCSVGLREGVLSAAASSAAALSLMALAWTFHVASVDFLDSVFYCLQGYALYKLLEPFCQSLPPTSRYGMQMRYSSLASEDNISWDLDLNGYQLSLLACDAAMLAAYLFYRNWILQDLLALSTAAWHIVNCGLRTTRSGLFFLSIFLVQEVAWASILPRALGTRVLDDCCRKSTIAGNIVVPHWLGKNEHPVVNHEAVYCGVAEIAIPGMYLALMLRFDQSRGRGGYCYHYFGLSVASYALGVILAFLFTDICGNKQSLIIMSLPCIVLPTLALAWLRGELRELLDFSSQ